MWQIAAFYVPCVPSFAFCMFGHLFAYSQPIYTFTCLLFLSHWCNIYFCLVVHLILGFNLWLKFCFNLCPILCDNLHSVLQIFVFIRVLISVSLFSCSHLDYYSVLPQL